MAVADRVKDMRNKTRGGALGDKSNAEKQSKATRTSVRNSINSKVEVTTDNDVDKKTAETTTKTRTAGARTTGARSAGVRSRGAISQKVDTTPKTNVAEDTTKDDKNEAVEETTKKAPARGSRTRNATNRATTKAEEKVETTKEVAKEPVEEKVESKTASKRSRGGKATTAKKDSKKDTTADVKPTVETSKKEINSIEDIEKEADKIISKEELINLYKCPTTSLDFANALASIRKSFVDENWSKYKTKVQKMNDEIIIDEDINEQGIKIAMSKLDKLRNTICIDIQTNESLLRKISDKNVEGWLDRVKIMNSDGANEVSRKKNGVVAAMSFTCNGENLNLYELYDETYERHSFLKGIMGQIEFRKTLLMNHVSLLKNK